MRLALTVVSPATRFWADVVIDADPATPVADVAAELERLAYGARSPGGAGTRGVGGGASPFTAGGEIRTGRSGKDLHDSCKRRLSGKLRRAPPHVGEGRGSARRVAIRAGRR